MDLQCTSCRKQKKIDRTGHLGIASGIFLAILPKCPFCVMAYTSTAMLCGEGAVFEVSTTHNSALTIFITTVLGLVTLAAIITNRKGKRTYVAFALSLLGLFMVLFSVIRFGGQPLYYTGILLVFTGVWLNGSLVWFWRNLKGGWVVGRKDLVG